MGEITPENKIEREKLLLWLEYEGSKLRVPMPHEWYWDFRNGYHTCGCLMPGLAFPDIYDTTKLGFPPGLKFHRTISVYAGGHHCWVSGFEVESKAASWPAIAECLAPFFNPLWLVSLGRAWYRDRARYEAAEWQRTKAQINDSLQRRRT